MPRYRVKGSCVQDCQPEIGLSLAGMANYVKNQASGYPGQWPRWDALEIELDAYLDEFPIAARVKLGFELTGEAPFPADAAKIRTRVYECLMALHHEQERHHA